MDWGILNAIAITLMAVFGIGVLYREHGKLGKSSKDDTSDLKK